MKTSADTEKEALSRIVESLQRPLDFASKDGFAHLDAVKGLEGLAGKLMDEARRAGLPDGEKFLFKDLEEVFGGFDALGHDGKKRRILRAKEILGSIRAGASGAAEAGGVLTLNEALQRLKKITTPLQYVKGIGPKLGERLGRKGLSTVEDALYFLPIRYEDRRNIKKIRDMEPGESEVATGEVMASGEARYGRRRVFEAVISDGTGLLKLKWFNYRLSYMKDRYPAGKALIVYGPVSVFGHQREIIHPDVEPLLPGDAGEGGEGIIPVYSQIEKLHQKTIRRLIGSIVREYAPHVLGAAPGPVAARSGCVPLADAFHCAHMPEGAGWSEKAAQARKSLVFDELFSLELGLAIKRRQVKRQGGLSMTGGSGELASKLARLLPFELTGAQKRAVAEIRRDMASPHPMNRLIQGDVGSGKTVVALVAVLIAVESGCQAAIMAPTEILAEQHFLNIHNYAEQLGVRVALLTGSLKKKEKAAIAKAVKQGKIDLVIGTHALIQKGMEFLKAGLFIIDEQHRFGVAQRAELKRKGGAGHSPDILVMTATPIPRTLSMTVFGDLDVSVIDEMPLGRKPVKTKIVRESERGRAYAAIRRELESGGQAYIVYPLVEESEELSLRDATRMKEHLESEIFPEFTVGLLHGRMKGEEKEAVMRAFKAGETDILVSTTVIEVGVDVPNATVIMVEHAERFGLAQLHQLRGRVGRGERPSLCLLLAQYTKAEDTWKRLKVLEGTMDGFRIAEEDLELRGPGDFLGTRQSGMPDFRTAGVFSDLTILKKARDEAFQFMEKDPGLSTPAGLVIREILKSRWKDRLELAEVG